MNNPLMFNDPSGEFIWFLGAAWAASHVFLAGVITAAFIGTAVGLVAYSLGIAMSGEKWQLGEALKSMFWGGVSGAVTFGIGSAFTPAAGTALTLTDKIAGAVAQGLVHGFSQGTLSLMQGANFTHGFASGVSGSWGASLFGGIAGSFANNTAGMIASGAVLGGVASELTGGNFWEGAFIGGFVAGFSYMANGIDTQVDYASADTSYGVASSDTYGDVLNWFNERDGGLYKVAQNDPGVPGGTIRIYAHGNSKGIQGADRYWIDTPQKFDRVLMERSPAWKNYRENGGAIRIELMSCNTGGTSNGIASRISKSFMFSTVIAPNNYFVAARNGSWSGVAGQYNLIKPGRWNYFVNGQNIRGIYDKYFYKK